MIKTAIVRARIDPKLKKKAEKILHNLGMSSTQYINLAFKQLEIKQGIPFDLHIPNRTTSKAIEEANKNKNLNTYDDVDDFFKKMGF